KLCGIFGAIYFLQVYYGVKLGFNPSTSPAWKFFSSIFAHSDLEHLFNNIFFIGLFGSIYERLTGSRVFILTFLVSAIFANLSAFIFFPESFIIGASGGGMGLMAALAVYRPNQPGLALGIPAPMWAALVVYVAINLAGLTGSTGTAYEAHLLGMLSGTVVGLSLRDGDEASDEDELDDFENFRERIREWEEKWMM
ncbi:MAG: rhomboid family intramembrane serine protease, partial [Candidatus Nanohaloarchaea archaeon]